MSTPAIRVGGVPIDAMGLDAASAAVLERSGSPAAVHLCNAYTISLAGRDPEIAELLQRGDLNLPDGMSLVWIARRLGIDLTERAYGPDVMAEVIDRGRPDRVRHYLYGSTPEVIDRLCTVLPQRWDGCEIVGAESPPFRALTTRESEEMVRRVSGADPDIVWVGLGTPAQDRFVDEYRDRLGTTLVAVGAAFDFFAGTRRQAPHVLQRAGMEWAWRLACEPRRLAKRYVVGNAQFVRAVLRDTPQLERGSRA